MDSIGDKTVACLPGGVFFFHKAITLPLLKYFSKIVEN